MSTILTISDTHFPYEHPKAFEFIRTLRDFYQPSEIVHMGDLDDQYWASQYDKDPEADSTLYEIDRMRARIRLWGDEFPEMKICVGNHSMRYIKKSHRNGLPRLVLKEMKDWMGFPKGWKLAEEWIIDGVQYFHGEPYRGISAVRNMLADARICRVHGHLHSKAGVYYETTKAGTHWILSTGCLIDVDRFAFNYERDNRIKPVVGTGVIADGVPMFEPLDKWV